MTTRTLKERVLAGERVLGAMILEFFVPALPQLTRAAGAEFLFLDMEHTGATMETLKSVIAGCRGIGLAPIVRVPATEYDFIARALDIGAHGVMVPIVETREQAEFIVSCSRYPPEGRRGAAFGFAHDDYAPGDVTEKIAAAHARTMIMALIETERGAANVDQIAAVAGIDVLWLGHFDLTNFLGIPGEFKHPRFLAAVDRIVAACERNGKTAGFLTTDESWVHEYAAKGFRCFAYGVDQLMLQQTLRSGLGLLRDAVNTGKR